MLKLRSILIHIGQYILRRLHLPVLAVLLVAMIEILNRGSLAKSWDWSSSFNNELFLNTLIAFALLLLVMALTGRTKIGYWLVFAFLLALGFISGTKMKILAVPLLPWDVLLANETANVESTLKELMPLDLVAIAVIFLIVSIGLVLFVPYFQGRYRWQERIVLGIASIALIGVVYADKPVHLQKNLGIYNVTWDQSDNYLRNGFLLTTVMNMNLVIIDEPDGYSKSQIAAIKANIPANPTRTTDVKPNIIVILSETFWDPTVMKNVTFSEDPLPHLRSLMTKYPSGHILSPQYGGGTANVEFEVLSGNSMRFLPQGSLAYIQYVNRPIDSLASILTRQGYSTAAINPFMNWFFNSRNVYHNFGFSKFISSEFFEPIFKGWYLADKQVAEVIENESAKTPGPDMIFANTMENHQPFTPNKFGVNTIQVTGSITKESKEMLETYATGLKDADLMLKELTEHYAKSPEPTIILYFGDHLPILGNGYSVLRDAKYITGTDDPDFLEKVYNTPFVVWDNYLPSHPEPLYFSPSFLGSYVLKEAGLPGTYYTDFLYDLSKRHPVIPPDDAYPKMNLKPEDVADYRKLQYDAMFGEQYGYGDWKDTIAHKDFKLGYGDIVLNQATWSAIGETKRLTVTGVNIVPEITLTLNGVDLKTSWVKENKGQYSVNADVPSDLLHQGQPLQVSAKIIDSKKIVIVRTNTLTIDAPKP